MNNKNYIIISILFNIVFFLSTLTPPILLFKNMQDKEIMSFSNTERRKQPVVLAFEVCYLVCFLFHFKKICNTYTNSFLIFPIFLSMFF